MLSQSLVAEYTRKFHPSPQFLPRISCGGRQAGNSEYKQTEVCCIAGQDDQGDSVQDHRLHPSQQLHSAAEDQQSIPGAHRAIPVSALQTGKCRK